MLRHSRPLRGRRDRFVNGYNLIGGTRTARGKDERKNHRPNYINDDDDYEDLFIPISVLNKKPVEEYTVEPTEEMEDSEAEIEQESEIEPETTEEELPEITPEQQKMIDKKIEEAIDYKTNPNRRDWFLYYQSFTPDELDVLHRYLTHSQFNGWMFNKVIGKDWQKSLPTRLDDTLKKYYSKDNKYLTSLKPFDKFYYAILKDKGLTENEIEAMIPPNNQSFDDLLLLNDDVGYEARTEAGSFFTSGVTSGKETNEVGWEAEKQFAETVYPIKYGNGTPLEITNDKYIYHNSYYEPYDFTVGKNLFEIKTQPKNKEVSGPLYYCQISKFYKIPSNVSVFTIWWGKIKSRRDLIENRTPITDWRYIDFPVNELGDGKRFHFKDDGLYDKKTKIAYKDVQGGHQYSQNPEATQIVFVDNDLKKLLIHFTASP